jgi:hypothetical protein
MALNAQILFSIVAQESSSGDMFNQMRVTPASYAASLTDGTGANQAQIAWSDSRVVGESESDDLVLTALADDRGTISFSSIKSWYVKNTSQYGVSLGRDQQGDDPPTNPWDGWVYGYGTGFSISPGGAIAHCSPSASGSTVGAGSRIRVSAPEGATYDIVLIGEGTIS